MHLARAVFLCLIAAPLACANTDTQHPDLAGLLALKATICGNCTELSSWVPEGDVCSAFDGVYCGWALGSWRVVGVQLQLDAAVVSFNDSAMSPAGVLAGISYLRELEVLCVASKPPGPGPPKPQPTPSNTFTSLHQQQQQQQGQHLTHLRQELQQDPAALEHQGLQVSRWLAAADAPFVVGSESFEQQQQEQWQQEQQQQQLEQQHAQQWQQHSPAETEQSGELPYSWFVAYPRLTHLRVVGCGAAGELQGEPVAQAKHLASLVLSHNNLTGSLPDEFAQLKGLSVLDLSANHLTGSLPLSWVALQRLHYLYLNNNNLTGILPCEYSQLQLLLADLSGNHWHLAPMPGELGCEPHSMNSTASTAASSTASAVASSTSSVGSTGSVSSNSSTVSQSLLASSSSSSSSSSRRQLDQHLHSAATNGALMAPRCWLRRFCYDEGAFICLQRQAKSAVGGCSSYVYGASDLHIDPLNQCDHGGSHLVAIAAMFAIFGTALLLIWLHHCRVMRWMNQPGSSGTPRQQQQQQQRPGPWQQRQWLISGPSPPSRARARSLGRGAGASAVLDSSSGLKAPLLSQAAPTLPLLYRPATSEHEGAGYSSPVSSSAAVDFFDASSAAAAAVGTPDGVLPSALTTPSAGAISIRPQGPGPLSGFSRGAQGTGAGGRGRGTDKGLVRSGGRGLGSGGNLNMNRGSQQELSSGYESDTSSVAGGSEGNRTTAHLSAAWLKPEYYFHGNEPLPPWAGGVARMLAATLAPASSGDDVSSSSGCFSGALMLPLVFLLLDFVTNLRLLLLWGVGPPPHVKLWPSYALLGLLCVPHVLVGAVVHFRLLAIACLPPALKAAAISEDQLLSEDILPPGAGIVVHVYSWLFGAPAWLAYPLILLLLGPGVLLLTLLCPLVLLMAGLGLGKGAGAVRYIQLLQGCAAMTQSVGSAALLTVLFLMGNLPLEWAFLDSSLYYLTAAADLANIAVAWWMRLYAVRRQQALALAALPTTTGQRWT